MCFGTRAFIHSFMLAVKFVLQCIDQKTAKAGELLSLRWASSLVPRPGNKASSSGDQIPVVTMVFILLGWTLAWALKITCERSINLHRAMP